MNLQQWASHTGALIYINCDHCNVSDWLFEKLVVKLYIRDIEVRLLISKLIRKHRYYIKFTLGFVFGASIGIGFWLRY